MVFVGIADSGHWSKRGRLMNMVSVWPVRQSVGDRVKKVRFFNVKKKITFPSMSKKWTTTILLFCSQF